MLSERGAPPLAVLVAPAGYGKTTLLREWAAHDERDFVWVTLDAGHDDPAVLLDSIATAVDELASQDGAPFVIVIDDLQVLGRPDALDAVVGVADALPPEATLALASRAASPLPIARLRAQRMITELGPQELAMTRAEAAALFRAAGHDLDRDRLDEALTRTEGWPVGLSLASLFLGDGSAGALSRFGGEDRLVAQYLRDEVIAELAPDEAEFAVRTSVADVLTAPLCDAVLHRAGSAGTLARLAGAGLVVPLDRTEDRYRYRRLLAEMLRAELRRLGPGLEQELHRRASAWHRRAGDVDSAARHALAAGDVQAAAQIACESAAEDIAHGRATVVESRLEWFTKTQIAGSPLLALASAGCDLARGHGHLVEHWIGAAAAAPPAPGDAGEAGVTMLRAVLARNGASRMREDAGWAYALLPDASPWRSVACLLEGTACLLAGERHEAARQLEEGTHRAAVALPAVHALCLAQLGMLELERGDPERATELSRRARAEVDRHKLSENATVALVYAAAALTRANRGSIDAAQRDLEDVVRLQHAFTDFPTWYEAEVGIIVTRATVRLGDLTGARTRLAECARLTERVPDAVALHDWFRDTRAQVDAVALSDGAPAFSLTPAEVRILQFLPSHLSFKEIANRAFVTANTVKSHVNSIYRKLDVGCRSDAVTRARSCGLLDAG